jgi:hypothetical protein
MSIYFINPSVKINSLNFKEIMVNMTNDISYLFVVNRNLIEEYNYNTTVNEIVNVMSKFLKIYNFYEYTHLKNIYNKNITSDKVFGKNINIQIYNSKIEVVIDINFIIDETFYAYQKSKWEQFYYGYEKKVPIVYHGLDNDNKRKLRISLVDGNFYMYEDVLIPIVYNGNQVLYEGNILKKKLCACENNGNCNINHSYIITIYWQVEENP